MPDDIPTPVPARPEASRPARAAAPLGQRRIDSATLLGPGGELFIDHQQQVYRLRVTSQGKLILTK
ncbi:MAG: hemin uptake protein HemP [Comamonadaceae bacterium]|jgi:hemin uptake protein HemP|nr:hemin uptake protein HemP [Comamonadaceae bacterium]